MIGLPLPAIKLMNLGAIHVGKSALDVCRRHLKQFQYEIIEVRAGCAATIRAFSSLGFAVVRAVRANRNRIGDMPTYILVRLRRALNL
jgi:hypothetical protein